jgi:hypothetical protein
MGETFGPPQEKTGANEPTGEHQRTSPVRWLRDRKLLFSLTAALSAATPLQHERLVAAEIPLGSTWVEGIRTLHKGVLSDKIETQGTFYIDNQTHRGKWIAGKEGTRTTVEYPIEDIKEAVGRELSAQPTQAITVCWMHNHPNNILEIPGSVSAEELQKIKEGKQSVSLPPSGAAAAMDGDISMWHTGVAEAPFEKFSEKGITINVQHGVVDAAGITYHRPIKDQELKQESLGISTEVEQMRAVLRQWEETISPLVDNLDTAILNELHSHTRNALKYLIQGYYSEEKKRQDVKEAVILGANAGGIENDDMARLLFKDNLKGLKLQHDFNHVLDKRRGYMGILDKARFALSKTSLTVKPEQLPTTKEYAQMREAYALNEISIRFVPHKDVPDEPPCAGTDYKP